jgi:hypothetical protein
VKVLDCNSFVSANEMSQHRRTPEQGRQEVTSNAFSIVFNQTEALEQTELM